MPPSRPAAGEPDRILASVLGPRERAEEARQRGYNGPPLFSQYAPGPAPRWKRWLSTGAFTLATLGFGAIAGYQYGLNASLQLHNPYDLGLFVRGHENGVSVHWNQYAHGFRGVREGVLTVTESSGINRVVLSRPELRNGQMFYRTAGPAAEFRLEIGLPEGRSLSQVVAWQR